MRRPEEIIYANDLQTLGYILGEMAEIISMLEENKEIVKLLSALNDFYAIHKTRTHDLLKLQDGIDGARQKYQKVLSQRNQYYKNWKEAEAALERYMERELNRGDMR